MLEGKTLLDFSVMKAEGIAEQHKMLKREGGNTQPIEGEVFFCRLQRMQSQTVMLSLIPKCFNWTQVKACTERTQQAEGNHVLLNNCPFTFYILVLIKCLLISKSLSI